MYGSPFDRRLTEELLDIIAPAVCADPVFLGKFLDAKNRANPVTLCGMNGDTSEEGMRQRLRINHERELGRINR